MAWSHEWDDRPAGTIGIDLVPALEVERDDVET